MRRTSHIASHLPYTLRVSVLSRCIARAAACLRELSVFRCRYLSGIRIITLSNHHVIESFVIDQSCSEGASDEFSSSPRVIDSLLSTDNLDVFLSLPFFPPQFWKSIDLSCSEGDDDAEVGAIIAAAAAASNAAAAAAAAAGAAGAAAAAVVHKRAGGVPPPGV